MGIDGVRALEQLMGTAHNIFNDRRETIFFFTREIKRWKGEPMLYRVASAGSRGYRWFDEVDGMPDDHDASRGLTPARTFYHASRPTDDGMARER